MLKRHFQLSHDCGGVSDSSPQLNRGPERYERKAEYVSTRTGTYERELGTKAGIGR